MTDVSGPEELEVIRLRLEAYGQAFRGSAAEEMAHYVRLFYQLMVTLAAGAIAGSATFFDRLPTSGRFVMGGAWLMLAFCLLAVLMSYYSIAEQNRKFVAGIDATLLSMQRLEMMVARGEPLPATDDLPGMDSLKEAIEFDSRISKLNKAAIGLLIAGVVLLLSALFTTPLPSADIPTVVIHE
jgi:hypothetical protein